MSATGGSSGVVSGLRDRLAFTTALVVAFFAAIVSTLSGGLLLWYNGAYSFRDGTGRIVSEVIFGGQRFDIGLFALSVFGCVVLVAGFLWDRKKIVLWNDFSKYRSRYPSIEAIPSMLFSVSPLVVLFFLLVDTALFLNAEISFVPWAVVVALPALIFVAYLVRRLQLIGSQSASSSTDSGGLSQVRTRSNRTYRARFLELLVPTAPEVIMLVGIVLSTLSMGLLIRSSGRSATSGIGAILMVEFEQASNATGLIPGREMIGPILFPLFLFGCMILAFGIWYEQGRSDQNELPTFVGGVPVFLPLVALFEGLFYAQLGTEIVPGVFFAAFPVVWFAVYRLGSRLAHRSRVVTSSSKRTGSSRSESGSERPSRRSEPPEDRSVTDDRSGTDDEDELTPDARESKEQLDEIRADLDRVETHLQENRPKAALEESSEIDERIDEIVSRARKYGLDSRAEKTESRHETLYNDARNEFENTRLDEIEEKIEAATEARNDGEYDDALDTWNAAIQTAAEARKTAEKYVPDSVEAIESRIREAERLQEEISAERDVHDSLTEELETIENGLDTAQDALYADDIRDALEHLEEAGNVLEDAIETAQEHDFEDVDRRIENLQDRRAELRQRAEDAILSEQLDDIWTDLDRVETHLQENRPKAALEESSEIDERIDEIVSRARKYGLDSRAEKTENRHETLSGGARNAFENARLDEIEEKTEAATEARNDGEYEKALGACDVAVDTAMAARETAEEYVPDAVEVIDERIEEVEKLQEEISAERDAHEGLTEELETIENGLDTAVDALDAGDPKRALNHIEESENALDDAATNAREYDFEDVNRRIENLQDRRAELRQRAEDALEATLSEQLEAADVRLSTARDAIDGRRYDDAFDACAEALETAKDARETAEEEIPHRIDEAESRVETAIELKDTIEAKRDADESLTAELNEIEDDLETAAGKLEANNPQRTLERLEDVATALDEVKTKAENHDISGIDARIGRLEDRCDRLRGRAEEALETTISVPDTIPTTPRIELSYDDIENPQLIGSGGNAEVYHATVTDGGREIELALKQPEVGETIHFETAERIFEEAETWQKLDDHDHIVSVVDYGSQPFPWIAMEYMDAGHLGDRAGKLGFEQALWTALAITRAVRHAHKNGVGHFDLKPENVLFRTVEDGWDVPKIADWGLSKHLLDDSSGTEGLTPHYAAPEQLESGEGKPVDTVTDIYQLGTVLYELFTGRPPFEGSLSEVVSQVKNETPTPPGEFTDLPSELQEILLTAIETDRDDRYEDVLYLRDDLESVFESHVSSRETNAF